MDKYTVDLDKVLNDFEYSELTEQNANNNNYNNEAAQVPYSLHYNTLQQQQQPYPKMNQSVSVKHTINNVFHSLNEYLNTDIGKTEVAQQPTTSSLEETVEEEEEKPIVKRKSSPSTDVTSIQDIFDTITTPTVCLIDDIENETKETRNESDEKTLEDNILIQTIDDSEDVSNMIETSNEDVNKPIEIDDSAIKTKTIGFNSLDLSDTEVENELAELEEMYDNEVQENEEGNNNSNNTKMDNNQQEHEDTIVSVSKTERNETDAVHSLQEKEEINQEQDIQTENNNESKHVVVVSEETKPKLLRPNSLDLNGDTLTINLIGEPGSTPYNNVYMETDKEPEESETDVADVNNSLSPTLSDASTYERSDSPNTSDSCNDTSIDEIHCNVKSNENETTTTTTATTITENSNNNTNGDSNNSEATSQASWLGKTAPFWTPDSDALNCLHCNQKFTLIRRRHHCRACGLVLCSKCCNMKYKLEFMDNNEAKVCVKCYEIFTKDVGSNSSGSENSPSSSSAAAAMVSNGQKLNPNNPMEYCSTIPPHQQVSNTPGQLPSVMVPVGVLKRTGSAKSRSSKSVMFCDGIRPGCDLTELDNDFTYKETTSQSQQQQQSILNTTSSGANNSNSDKNLKQQQRNVMIKSNEPKMNSNTNSFIPSDDDELPPIVTVIKADTIYTECHNGTVIIETLRRELVTFAINRNFHVQVKIINMDCCINKEAWCFSTVGLITVGQDEIVILLEMIEKEKTVPTDVLVHLNQIYQDAVKGTSITELGISLHSTNNFLGSKNHAGFLYMKPTFQCVQNVTIPHEPYLIGILIHRWETPWAKIFPLRLLLRLGAQYRYYPSPIISTRHRESVYVEIGHTIINLLADFRNFSYTIPSVRGLTIHMAEKNTTVSVPRNRYDQVMKALNNGSDHILAFAANFSALADSHLVCIQDTDGNNENAYTTHAINIHNKERKVTGASFIVLNGALKSTSGLTAKSSIVEDGLMVQILPENMVRLRNNLRNMLDFKINCGCVNVQSDECVNIVWTENDVNFNTGVVSPIDNMSLSGVPSIRVHNGRDYVCNSGTKAIRWTEVFIIESGDENESNANHHQHPLDVSKVSENISKATSQALVKYLDLLATNCFTKIGIRTTLNVENVSYLAGSNNTKLPPIYMKSLDNELVPVLHRIIANQFAEQTVVLELVFHILNM